MTIVLFIKVAISAIVPASKDMADTINFAMSIGEPQSLNGPWILLTAQILNAWHSLTSTTAPLQTLLTVPPSEMPTDLRLLILLLRLPTIMFDVAIAAAVFYAVMKITSSAILARLAALAWFLNPYATFGVEMLGVPDVSAAFFTVIAFILLQSKRPASSGLALGAGIALKLYPIFFLPQVLFFAARIGSRRRFRILMLTFTLLGFLAYFAWALQVGWAALSNTAVDYTPVTTPIGAIFDFSPQARLSVAAFALIILSFVTWSLARNPKTLVSHTILPALLVYYTFSDPRPQYLIWALPLLTIDVAIIRRRNFVPLIITLALMFGLGLLLSKGYSTPSGYSLLLFPLQGQDLPWYSQAIVSFFKDPIAPIVLFPLVRATLAATTLIYALEIIRSWSPSTPEQTTQVTQLTD